jgi:hypothetical protein
VTASCDKRSEFIAKLHKQAAAVYIACDESVAKDISESLSHAAMLLSVTSAALSMADALRAIDEEPELPGEPPKEMMDALRSGDDALMIAALRIAVIQTKDGIRQRLRSLPSTGEFTKHPRCANGCETARKWGTKPCEGFCEWLPQKTASPIDAGERVKERCYHGLDDSCPNCDPVRFGTESPINAAKKKP